MQWSMYMYVYYAFIYFVAETIENEFLIKNITDDVTTCELN